MRWVEVRWVIRLVFKDDIPKTGQLCVPGNWDFMLGKGLRVDIRRLRIRTRRG